MNPLDLAERGLEHGDRVVVEAISTGRMLTMAGLTATAHEVARGSVAAYYPEANMLVPLDYIDDDSGTPSYKSIPVRIRREAVAPAVSVSA